MIGIITQVFNVLSLTNFLRVDNDEVVLPRHVGEAQVLQVPHPRHWCGVGK